MPVWSTEDEDELTERASWLKHSQSPFYVLVKVNRSCTVMDKKKETAEEYGEKKTPKNMGRKKNTHGSLRGRMFFRGRFCTTSVEGEAVACS